MSNGFVYIWFDTQNKMYYVGSHWGSPDDTYICSSPWMKRAYKNRPHHFKRRIIKTFTSREEMIKEEDRYLSMMKPDEFRTRYYNMRMGAWDLWHHKLQQNKTIGQKISAAKKGKKTGKRDPSVGEAISAAKLAKNAEKRAIHGFVSSSEHVEKIRSSLTGRTLLEAHRQAITNGLTDKYQKGWRQPAQLMGGSS